MKNNLKAIEAFYSLPFALLHVSPQLVFRVSDEQRDISRPMGVIFGVHRNQIWGASCAKK